jgi:uncharacterized protein DUF6518
VLLAAAVAFGIAASIIKGNGPGIRDGLGNLSAPWVTVPMLISAAASRGRIALGALLGFLATALALAGFYLANAFVLDLGAHSTAHNIGLTLNGGNLWFKAGLVSGPVMGVVGAWQVRRGRRRILMLAALLVLFEPLAVFLAWAASRGYWAAGNGEWNGVYFGEAIVGSIATGALWRNRLRRQHRHSE